MSRIDRRTLVATTLATALGNIVRPSWGFARETEPDGHTGNVTTFGEDVTFVRRHAKVIVLSNPQSQARVAVCPDMQGRVLTSSAAGDAGASFGWINHELIASGKNNPQFNAFGGEDRFWLGPEGGQFGLYFKPGKPFDLQNWCVPKPINEEPFEMAQRQKNRALFRKKMHVTNYSGTRFDIDLRREICLLTAEQIRTALSVALAPQVSAVAFQSDNRITNIGTSAWEKRSGLPSIWIIGMFRPSTSATVVIPIVPGDEDELGPAVRHYFGQVPAERLTTTKSHIFFRGDGMQRGKIGVSRKRARPVMGSYDARSEVLTVVQYTLPRKATDYVNSTLEIQKAPYDGDVVNSYNDGPLEPGGQPFGPFFELETSSLAAKLKPGDSMRHVHRTFHFQGPKQHLDALSKAVLGVELKEIEESL
ncbi:MAG: hypothetical protein JXM70_01600 [Pirellulales bacterium]|nr:hypothetical protein [Pirellulales bacterium]